MHRLLVVTALLPLLSACDLLVPGDECSVNSDCSGDDICDRGECVECEDDRDCDDDEQCDDGECEDADEGGEGQGEPGGEGEGEPGGEGEGEPGGEGEGEPGGEGEGEPGGEGEGEPGGEGEGETPCGSVPGTGICVGNEMQICIDGALETLDCDDPALPAGTDCDFVNAAWGSDCKLPLGETCLLDGGEEVGAFQTFCQGTNAGCVVSGDATSFAATCTANVGTCSFADVDARCDGSRLVLACLGVLDEVASNGQPLYVECSSLGASCNPTVQAGVGGCVVTVPGANCLPGVSVCGPNPATAVACPDTGVCP